MTQPLFATALLLCSLLAPATQPADKYPLDVCVVSGDKLDADSVTKTIGDRPVKFCCANCVAAFEKEPAKYNAKMDELIIAKMTPLYPTKECIVSHDALGEMGNVVKYVDHKTNTLFLLCCKGCEGTVAKNPEKYVKKLELAAAPATQPAE